MTWLALALGAVVFVTVAVLICRTTDDPDRGDSDGRSYGAQKRRPE